MQLFQSAILKLTAWYLLIIMVISLTFSLIIYHISSSEFGRDLPRNGPALRQLLLDPQAFELLRQERIDQTSERLVRNLFILNIATLGLGATASYFLARRTLDPIQVAMDEQGRFTTDASHELRTPLTVMRSEIEVALRNNKLSPTAMRALLSSNLEEVNKLHALSDRLLLLSSERALPLENISLENVAIEALNRSIPLAQGKNISIENNITSFMVKGNADSLADLLTILIDNAIKYSNPGTTVNLTAQKQGKTVAVSVIDQGQGIKAADLPHIFNRFYRADTSRTKQVVDGHGLGLSIAQRIAELHGSHLNVTSTVGTGTEFSLRLLVATT